MPRINQSPRKKGIPNMPQMSELSLSHLRMNIVGMGTRRNDQCCSMTRFAKLLSLIGRLKGRMFQHLALR
jgi:hypothetical protein